MKNGLNALPLGQTGSLLQAGIEKQAVFVAGTEKQAVLVACSAQLAYRLHVMVSQALVHTFYRMHWAVSNLHHNGSLHTGSVLTVHTTPQAQDTPKRRTHCKHLTADL